MRVAPIFSIILTLGGLILLLLLLFATNSFLPGADIMTVNVFQGGNLSICNSAHPAQLDFFCNSTAVDLVYSDGNTTAVDLSSFFKIYAQNSCQGHILSDSTVGDPRGPIISCTPSQAGYFFSLSNAVADLLPTGITLSDLDWPSAISNDDGSVKSTSIALFFFIVLGVALAVLSCLACLWCVLSERRLPYIMSTIIHTVEVIIVMLAGSVATALSVNTVNEFNSQGQDYGISASVGVEFLGMIWGASVFMLCAASFTFAQCCAGWYNRGYSKLGSRHMFMSGAGMQHPHMGHHNMHGWDTGLSHPMAYHMTPMGHSGMASPGMGHSQMGYGGHMPQQYYG